MERRTLIRLFIGLAIGIPVLVEVLTFLGLVERELFDDRGGTRPTGTATPDRVGVGEELLPGTEPIETVTEAEIRGQDTPWLFVLTVEIQNPLEVPYELRLGTLTLGSGRTVAGGASSGQVPAGGTGEVTGAWELPEGSTPDVLNVRAITYGAAGPEETTAAVDLAKVPVRGS